MGRVDRCLFSVLELRAGTPFLRVHDNGTGWAQTAGSPLFDVHVTIEEHKMARPRSRWHPDWLMYVCCRAIGPIYPSFDHGWSSTLMN